MHRSRTGPELGLRRPDTRIGEPDFGDAASGDGRTGVLVTGAGRRLFAHRLSLAAPTMQLSLVMGTAVTGFAVHSTSRSALAVWSGPTHLHFDGDQQGIGVAGRLLFGVGEQQPTIGGGQGPLPRSRPAAAPAKAAASAAVRARALSFSSCPTSTVATTATISTSSITTINAAACPPSRCSDLARAVIARFGMQLLGVTSGSWSRVAIDIVADEGNGHHLVAGVRTHHRDAATPIRSLDSETPARRNPDHYAVGAWPRESHRSGSTTKRADDLALVLNESAMDPMFTPRPARCLQRESRPPACASHSPDVVTCNNVASRDGPAAHATTESPACLQPQSDHPGGRPGSSRVPHRWAKRIVWPSRDESRMSCTPSVGTTATSSSSSRRFMAMRPALRDES